MTTKLKKPVLLALTIALLSTISLSIEIPLHQQQRCMILSATFQPIKVEIQFPPIPNKVEGERYKVSLYKLVSGALISEEFVEGEFLYRKNFKLQPDVLYHICMEVVMVRTFFQPDQQIYANFVATQDFQTLIGKIEIPPELSGEQNLQSIYKVAKQLTNLNKGILQNQKKERELQDQLVNQNLHTNQRIYTLTLIEYLVIVLSGVYQVFALRRFLIEKNLY